MALHDASSHLLHFWAPGSFSPCFSPASNGTFQSLSSATSGKSLFLAAASTSGAGHHSPIYHSLQLAASLNKRSPSYFAIMLCSQAQLFPVPGKDGAELGNSPRTYAFVFSPLRPKQAGLQLLNTPRKAGVRLGWCLARGAGWPS